MYCVLAELRDIYIIDGTPIIYCISLFVNFV